MNRLILLALPVLLLASYVHGQEKDVLILFQVTSDGATAGHLSLINTEIHRVLVESRKFRLITADELIEETLMSPAESLAFCNDEPECISDLGSARNAKWILYGNIKQSFDGNKVLVHLVRIDAALKKTDNENYGQFDKESDVVAESANLLCRLLDIELPKPEPDLALDLTPRPEPAPKPVAEIARGQPETKPEPAPAMEVKAVKPEKKDPWTNPWTWTAAGVGVASITTAVVLGVLSRRKQNDAKTPGLDQPSAYDLVGEAEELALGANIAYGLGGAALAAAVVIFILDVTCDAPPAVPSVACSQTGCALVLSARF